MTGGIDPTTVLYNELRSVVLAKIEEGRRQLGQDLIVKTEQGDIANEGNTPTMQLYKKVRTLLRNFISSLNIYYFSIQTCNTVNDYEGNLREMA